MKTITLPIDYSPGIHYIDEYCEVKLDNGHDVNFNLMGTVYVKEDAGLTYYDEPQQITDVDLKVDIIEVWNGEELVELNGIEETNLKIEILSYIE